jgi:uncharacterized membrane protein HdeD (DUF308 family)
MGLIVYPYYCFVELLAPFIEALGLAGLAIGLGVGAVDLTFAGLFFLVAYGLGLLLDGMTLVLEEFSFHRYEGFDDRALLLLWAALEQFGYRQLTIFWRLRGMVRFLRGRRDWGAMQRKGFGSPSIDLK